jgi:hypothetical protein
VSIGDQEGTAKTKAILGCTITKLFSDCTVDFLKKKTHLNFSVADLDPGSGDFLTSGSRIRMGKKSNIPDHISESLVLFYCFGLKLLEFFVFGIRCLF